MAWQPLVALLAFAYMAFVIYVGVTKKPDGIWNMGKVQTFIKLLGEKGTQIFFVIFGIAVGVLGILVLTIWS